MGEFKYGVNTKCNTGVSVKMGVNAALEIPERIVFALTQSCMLNFALTPNATENVSVILNFLLGIAHFPYSLYKLKH